ncbi:MAG: glycosyltransferase family 4 protein [Chloroflexota bacterium]
MRILHLVHQFVPEQIGGTELYTQALARHLVARGHQVAILYRRSAEGSGLEAWEDEQGVQMWATWSGTVTPIRRFVSAFNEAKLLRAFSEVAGRFQPDVVHLQHLMGWPAAIADFTAHAAIPLLITLHDYWWLCANAQLLTNDSQVTCDGPRWWLNCGRCALARTGWQDFTWLAPLPAPLFALRERRLRQVLAQARLLIAPSEFVYQVYQRLGVAADRMRVILHGIEGPAGPLATRRPASGPGELRLAYVGGLAWQKGVHVLVEAANQLPHDGFHLSIYGNTAAFPDYVASLAQAIRHPGIRLEGRLTRPEFWDTLAQMDAVVVPTLWYEASPLIIQEAFAAGVPVIASDIGALSEKVRHGVDGLLTPAGDVAALRDLLRELMEEPGRLDTLRAGIRPVRRIEEHVAEVEAAYAAASTTRW